VTRTETELQELLRQGAAAARVGERDAAQEAFRRAAELDPDSKEAWLGLAGAVESPVEKRACFERVLEIDPGNPDAQAGLAWVSRKEEEKEAKQAYIAVGRVEPAPSLTTEPILTAPTEHAGDEPIFCHFHPNVETVLRCNKCGKPICAKCARRTPVGYRCPDCIRSQQATFYSAGWLDYALVVVVGLVASTIGAAIVVSLGIWFAILLGPVAGGIIAEAARWAARRRRGRYMAAIVSGCIVIGALPMLLFVGLNLWGLGGLVIYVATALGTAYARLR
jgi:tetratricopeptide (TPR) repeat protein